MGIIQAMNESTLIIFLALFVIVVLISYQAVEATNISVPPRPAFVKITTANDTVRAMNYSSWLHLKGLGPITITGSNDSKTIYINSTGSNSTTSGITSINSQIGPAINIVGSSGNITITNSTNQIKINIGTNVIVTNSPQLTNKVRAFSQAIHGTTSNATVYYSVNDVDQSSSTESLTDSKIGFACTLQRLGFHVTGNAKINPFTLSFRVNGVSFGTTTVNGGVTGYFETTGINKLINPGDKVNFQLNALAAGTGSLTIRGIMAECQ